MGTGLTEILASLLSLIGAMSDRLEPVALAFLGSMFAFEMVVSILWKKEEEDLFKIIATRLGLVYILAIFIKEFKSITESLYETFVSLAGIATGTNGLDPKNNMGQIVENGLVLFKPILEKAKFMEAGTWIFLIIAAVGIVLFVIIAIKFFTLFLEYAVMMGLLIIFIPFLMFSKTRFISEKIWSIVITQNIRILFMIVVYNLLAIFLVDATVKETLEELVIYTSGLLGMATIVLNAPAMAAGIASGVPQLDLNAVGNTIKGGVAAAKSAGNKIMSAGKTAGNAGVMAQKGSVAVGKAGMAAGNAVSNAADKIVDKIMK